MNQQILRTIQKEYDAYKISMIEAGAEEIWKSSMRATAWQYIKDFLEGNADNDDGLLVRLYKCAGNNILSRFVSKYMKSEGYDIASWEDIRSLVLDYLEYGIMFLVYLTKRLTKQMGGCNIWIYF